MNSIPSSLLGRTTCLRAVSGCILLLALLAVPAAANPPSAMSLAYDPAAAMLSVTITHPVAGTPGHYIGDVKISVNGNMISDTKYTGQPSDTFTYTYPLVLKPGDTVEVIATCSLAGSATRAYSVPAAPGTATSPVQSAGAAAPTQKSSAFFLTAAGSLLLLIMFRKMS